MSELTKTQIMALRELGPEPWHYRVNWLPMLSNRGRHDLLERGFIKEAWTWASGTRPDTCITDAGVRALFPSATNVDSDKGEAK